MRAVNVTSTVDPDIRSLSVRVAEAVLSAFRYEPDPPLALIWVRPLAEGENASGTVYDFDPRGCRALLHRGYPNVIFANASELARPVEEIAHECGHVLQNAGLAPSEPDIEAWPTQLGQDVCEDFDSSVPEPIASLFFHHGRAEHYRTIRNRASQYPARMIWRAAEPPRPSAFHNHAAELLAEARRLPKGATAFGLLRGFRAW